MRAWRVYIKSILLNREYKTNYCQDALYQFFLDQVILSAFVIKAIKQKEN
jgi:hypothetical protein